VVDLQPPLTAQGHLSEPRTSEYRREYPEGAHRYRPIHVSIVETAGDVAEDIVQCRCIPLGVVVGGEGVTAPPHRNVLRSWQSSPSVRC
jgi:hypothetical protein